MTDTNTNTNTDDDRRITAANRRLTDAGLRQPLQDAGVSTTDLDALVVAAGRTVDASCDRARPTFDADDRVEITADVVEQMLTLVVELGEATHVDEGVRDRFGALCEDFEEVDSPPARSNVGVAMGMAAGGADLRSDRPVLRLGNDILSRNYEQARDHRDDE